MNNANYGIARWWRTCIFAKQGYVWISNASPKQPFVVSFEPVDEALAKHDCYSSVETREFWLTEHGDLCKLYQKRKRSVEEPAHLEVVLPPFGKSVHLTQLQERCPLERHKNQHEVHISEFVCWAAGVQPVSMLLHHICFVATVDGNTIKGKEDNAKQKHWAFWHVASGFEPTSAFETRLLSYSCMQGAMNYPYRGVFLTKQIVSPLTTWYCTNAAPLSGFRTEVMRCESAFFFAPTYSSEGNPLVKWVGDFSLTASIALIACLFFLLIGFMQAIPFARFTNGACSAATAVDPTDKTYRQHTEGNRCTRTYTFPDWLFMFAHLVISCVCIALLLWMPNSWQRVWSGNPLIEFQRDNFMQKMNGTLTREGYYALAGTLILSITQLSIAVLTPVCHHKCGPKRRKQNFGLPELQDQLIWHNPSMHHVELSPVFRSSEVPVLLIHK